jgi:tripartite-type tricarboxylate transporter receptor subunit TctC
MMKRCLVAAIAAAIAVLGFGAVEGRAQLLQQPVRIVFPFAAGGVGDALSRLMAEQLRVGLNRTVVVENKSGGAGQMGVIEVTRAEPNGDTLLLTPIAPVVVYQNVYKNLKYDPFKDLKPVSLVADFEFAIGVGSNVPAKSLQELVAWLKANPKQAAYGSPGAGSLPHFFGVLFSRAIGVDMVHVPYRGSSAALTDLMGGHIPVVVTTTSDLLAAHRAGKISILATSDSRRSPLLTDIPTFIEQGYSIEGTSWYAMFAPANTPDEVVDRYGKILTDALKTPEMKEQLLQMGLYAHGSTPADLARLQRQHADHWAPAVKASGFSPTD